MIIWLVCLLTTCSQGRADQMCRIAPFQHYYILEAAFTCKTTWYGFPYAAIDNEETARTRDWRSTFATSDEFRLDGIVHDLRVNGVDTHAGER